MDRRLHFRFTWLLALKELFYPGRCRVCDTVLVGNEQYLCAACLADFPVLHEGFDKERALLDSFAPACRPEALHALFYYNKFSPYKQLIYGIKYGGDRKLGVYLGRMLGSKMKGKSAADAILPVPLHPKRERERGFNQAREIARGVAEVLGIELLDDVLVRTRNNVSQTGKTASERLANVSGIFELRRPERIAGRHVLLLDDVITTGATIGACLEALSSAPDTRISLACLARTQDA